MGCENEIFNFFVEMFSYYKLQKAMILYMG